MVFSRIKRLFRNEDEDRDLLALDNKDWKRGFVTLFEAKQDMSQLGIIKSINQELILLKSKADDLLNAEPNDKNIDIKTLEKIEDSRATYVTAVKNLADKSFINEEKAVLHIKETYQNFVKNAQEFSSASGKVYYLLKDLFPEPMASIAETFKGVADSHKALYATIKTGAGKDFEDMKEKTKQYYNDTLEKNKLHKEIDEARADIEFSEQKLFNLERRKESLMKLPDFARFKEDYEKKQKIDERIKSQKEELVTTIKHEEDLLLKLEGTYLYKKTIQKYLDDPVSMLNWDEKIEIAGIFTDLKNALAEKKIDVDSKRKQKILSTIERIEKNNFFQNWIVEYKNLLLERKSLEDSLSKAPVMVNLSDNDYQVAHVNDMISKKKSFLSFAEERLKVLNLEERKQKLEQDLNTFSGKKIILT